MTDTRTDRYRKLFVWADQLELTREERLEIACYLLRRPISSFDQLTDDQVGRLLDAFEGSHLVASVLSQRP